MLSCQEIDDTLSPIFTPLTANKQYPGILVGVTTGSADGHCYSSFGNVPLYQGSGAVATEDIVFFIGSNTKVVTATLLALGNFNKSVLPVSGATLVTDLLPPGAKINFYEGQALHLWHLATHSAGYPDPPCGQTALGNFTFAQLVTFLQHFTPPYGPGIFWHYSDAGFALLGVLMSHAFTQGSGTSTDTIFDTTYSNWPLVAANNVLSPLGMNTTQSGYSSAVLDQIAQGYVEAGEIFNTAALPDFVPNTASLGAGSLSSTLSDMLTFLDAQISPPSTKLGNAIAWTQTGHADLHMGLGWQLGEEFCFKNGLVTGFASYMAFVPAPFGGLGIFAVANSEGADKGGALCAAAQQALGQLRGSAARTFKFPTPTKIPRCP